MNITDNFFERLLFDEYKYLLLKYEKQFPIWDYDNFAKQQESAVVEYFSDYVHMKDYCKEKIYPVKPSYGSNLFYDNCA